jgi:hypothetical protein
MTRDYKAAYFQLLETLIDATEGGLFDQNHVSQQFVDRKHARAILQVLQNEQDIAKAERKRSQHQMASVSQLYIQSIPKQCYTCGTIQSSHNQVFAASCDSCIGNFPLDKTTGV